MKKVLLTLVFAVALVSVSALGYRVGRGGVVLPTWVPTQVSQLLAGFLTPGVPKGPALSTADLKDYEFRLVDQSAKLGAATVAVELVHKATGKPVPEAVIVARRIDMAPENMAMMTAPLEPVPATEPGIHRFRTNLVMAGGWQLSLAAKVPGEAGTVQSKLILKAVE